MIMKPINMLLLLYLLKIGECTQFTFQFAKASTIVIVVGFGGTVQYQVMRGK